MEGFRTTTVYAGAQKNDFNPHETLKDGARQTLQIEVDRVYGLFVDTVARDRGLTAEDVRATEARLFFGEDAVRAGLADEVGTLRDALASLAARLAQPQTIVAAPAALAGPASRQPHNRKEHVMNDETDTVKTERETPPTPKPADTATTTDAAKPEPTTAEVVDLDAVRAEARGEGAAEAGLIAELCTLAGMPERTADMLAKGLSADEVRRELLNLKAGADAEVQSHVLPGAGTGAPQNLDDNPVVRAATARAAAAKEV